MGESIKSKISNICTVISVISLIYKLCYSYFIEGVPFQQTVLHSPLDYIITFVPIIVGIIINLSEVIAEGLHGPKTVKPIMKPAIIVLTILIEFIVIDRFKMYEGFVTDSSIDNDSFLKGLLFLVLISVLEAVVIAFFEGDLPHAVWTRTTFWSMWFTLSAVLGCLQTNQYIAYYQGTDVFIAWLCSVSLLTILCSILLFVYLVFALPVFLLRIFI